MIDQRFMSMIEKGALDEIKNLLAQNLDPDHPILKATGVESYDLLFGGNYVL